MEQNRISKTLYNGYVNLVLTVNEVAIDKVNNTSTVEWELWLERNTTYVYNLYGTSVASVYFNWNDVIFEQNVTYDLRDKSWVSFGKGRKVIQHDKDGSKAFTIWARLTDVAGFGDLGWFSGTAKLTEIDRESQVKRVTATELGQPVSVEIDRKIETFKHTVWYRVNSSEWIEVGTNVAYAKEFVPPIELAEKVTASDTGALDICVRTFTHEGKQIGDDAYSYGNKIKVPESLVPTFERLEVDDASNDTALTLKAYNFIQDRSKIRVNIVGASSVYGATIQEYRIRVRSQSVSSQSAVFTSKDVGRYDVEAEVIDTRGRKHVKTQPITVHAYSTPRINLFIPARAGNRTNRNVKSQVNVHVPAIEIDGRNVNEYRITVRYAVRTGGAVTYNTALTTTDTVVPFVKVLDLGNVYNLEQAYDIELAVTDKFNSTAKSERIVGTANVLAVLSRLGLSIGAIPEENEKNMFTVSIPSKFKNSVDFSSQVLYWGLPMQTRQLTDELGNALKLKGYGDCNHFTQAGYFEIEASYNNLPKGVTDGVLQVAKRQDVNKKVIYQTLYTGDKVYTRSSVNDNWKGWNTMAETTQWNRMALESGWQHYSAYGDAYYSKVGNVVHLRGNIWKGDNGHDKSIATLPEGFRPTQGLYVRALNNNYLDAILYISPAGRISTRSGITKEWLNFDNVSFLI